MMLLRFEAVTGEDWPHWRGPNRNDVVTEDSGFTRGAWPPKAELWSAGLGEGSTSPIVVDGKLYTLGWSKGRDSVVCLDAASGKELWRQSYACPEYGRESDGDKGLYGGVTPTPSFDPATGWLFTLGNDGDLYCWDARQDGQRRWNLNLYDKYQPPMRPKVGRSGRRDYGYTTSPLVWNDWVIVEVGSPQHGNTIAFSKETGREVWRSQSKDHAGHSGGLVPIVVEGIPCAAIFTFAHLLVMRLDAGHEGETVAEYPWMTSFANSIATPAVHENYVLVTAAYNHEAMCKLEITLRGARKVWEVEESSGVCSPVIHKGSIYWASRNLRCLDFETGRVRWKGDKNLGSPGSCIVTGDDRIIVWAGRGELLLAETAVRSPARCTELASLDGVFRSDAWPHVVLSDGLLFCKERNGAIKCFDLRGRDK
ncbi:MAG: PQQ-binding-like beta-propeller repeat protein [Pirellulaceae bacterium]